MTPEAFKQARRDLGMTQPAFAAALGLSVPSIARMEAGRQAISLTVELALREVTRHKPKADREAQA